MDNLKLINKYSSEILDLIDNQGNITRSDLQGIVDALVMRIVNEKTSDTHKLYIYQFTTEDSQDFDWLVADSTKLTDDLHMEAYKQLQEQYGFDSVQETMKHVTVDEVYPVDEWGNYTITVQKRGGVK